MGTLTPLWRALGASTFLGGLLVSQLRGDSVQPFNLNVPLGIILWGKFSIQDICRGA